MLRPIGAFAFAVLALGVAVAPASAATPTVSVSTGLTPAFSRSVTDYVTKCATGSVSVTTNVPSGTSVKIDGRTVRSGRVVTKLKLSAGQRFILISKVGSSSIAHSIRCLPTDFPASTATGRLPSVAPFVALSAMGSVLSGAPAPFALVLDANGTPVWWKKVARGHVLDVKPVPGGRIGFWEGEFLSDGSTGPFSVYTLAGTLVRSVTADGRGNDLHEVLPAASGNFYRLVKITREHVDLSASGGPSDRTIFSNRIDEIDPAGRIVWSWDTFDHIGQGEGGRWTWLLSLTAGADPFDVDHLNSIEEDGKGGLILSLRHRDAIYRIDKASGNVTWKFGGTATSESLAVRGDERFPGATFGGQHDARLQPDGTITVYDNGSGYSDRAPRATRWRVDTAARTATLVESVSDPDIHSSIAGGSARRLSDGSWLVSWSSQPVISAYSASHAKTFSVRFNPSKVSYRAAPISTSQITREKFVIGMDAQYPRPAGG